MRLVALFLLFADASPPSPCTSLPEVLAAPRERNLTSVTCPVVVDDARACHAGPSSGALLDAVAKVGACVVTADDVAPSLPARAATMSCTRIEKAQIGDAVVRIVEASDNAMPAVVIPTGDTTFVCWADPPCEALEVKWLATTRDGAMFTGTAGGAACSR